MADEPDPNDVSSDAPRWNTWVRVQPVQFDGEVTAKPRAVRLCCACARAGDAVQISEGEQVVEGRIIAVAHSILRVARNTSY